MRRRLEIARGLIHRPKVLFLDEPTLGLDPQSRRVIWDILRDLRREDELTISLTTHYLDEADALCDRIAIVDHGKIIALGTPAELKSHVPGSDTIELTLAHPASDAVLAELRRLTGVRELEPADKALSVRADGGSELLPRLLVLLGQHGITVTSASLSRVTLEDTFIYFTGRSLREEAPVHGPALLPEEALMGKLWAVMQRDLLRMMRNPITLLGSVVLPLVYLLILGNSLQGPLKDLPLGVVAFDQGPETRRLLGALQAIEHGPRPWSWSHVDGPEAGMRALRDGSLSALVVIPPRFSADLERGVTASAGLFVDNVDAIAADAIEGAVASALTAVRQPLVRYELHLGGAQTRPEEIYPRVDYDASLVPGVIVDVDLHGEHDRRCVQPGDGPIPRRPRGVPLDAATTHPHQPRPPPQRDGRHVRRERARPLDRASLHGRAHPRRAPGGRPHARDRSSSPPSGCSRCR